MATLHLDLDDRLFRRLQASAEARGCSVEEDVHRLIVEHASPEDDEEEGERRRLALVKAIEEMQALRIPLPEGVSDTAELIRQMREEEEDHLLRVVRGEA